MRISSIQEINQHMQDIRSHTYVIAPRRSGKTILLLNSADRQSQISTSKIILTSPYSGLVDDLIWLIKSNYPSLQGLCCQIGHLKGLTSGCIYIDEADYINRSTMIQISYIMTLNNQIKIKAIGSLNPDKKDGEHFWEILSPLSRHIICNVNEHGTVLTSIVNNLSNQNNSCDHCVGCDGRLGC